MSKNKQLIEFADGKAKVGDKFFNSSCDSELAVIAVDDSELNHESYIKGLVPCKRDETGTFSWYTYSELD